MRALYLFISLSFFPSLVLAAPPVEWRREFAAQTFADAKRDNRLVLLDLEAVWCHWCHVMDEKTYSQENIRELLGKKYITVRIDQDARPDLGNRFREYGWPATIIFSSEGEELEKLAGFVEPVEMEKILRELAANPKPRTEKRNIVFSDASSLSPTLRDELKRRYEASLDRTLGGLKTSHRFLEVDTIEYGLKQIRDLNDANAQFVKLSLQNNEKLLDPIWGGVYQYSTNRDWDHPHFEKIAVKQADNLRLYAEAYAIFKAERDLASIKNIRGYLKRFLQDQSSGAFYTSQDADVVKGEHSAEYFELTDAERLKRGIPAIDKNIYASENGRIISALAIVYASTKDQSALDEAKRAADWILKNRALPDGGFRHGEKDPVGGPYLCDTLYMSQGMLSLYAVTGEREWLERAKKGADFIAAQFSPKEGEAGFVTSKAGAGVFKPLPLVSENIDAVRFLGSLVGYTGDERYRKLGGAGMRYIGAEGIALENITEVGVVLADEELNNPPLHITVVGKKGDTGALELFKEALQYPAVAKRSEWWDRAEGPMPNPDVQYPPLPKSAAFVCTNQRCSLPIFKPDAVAETVRKLSAPQG